MVIHNVYFIHNATMNDEDEMMIREGAGQNFGKNNTVIYTHEMQRKHFENCIHKLNQLKGKSSIVSQLVLMREANVNNILSLARSSKKT